MICQDRIYTNTDIPIFVTFPSVATSDIADLYVKFVNHDNPEISKEYLMSTGGITIVDDVIKVQVFKEDITTPGKYDIYMKRTDQAGNELGVNACPSWVIFYQMF